MFFKCKVCEEKDKRISELKDNIKYLQNMLNPQASNMVNVEANKMLDGSSLPVVEVELSSSSEDKIKEDEKILREANAILTGEYSEVLN